MSASYYGIRVVIALLALLALDGCGSQTNPIISAVPRHICAGEPVHIHWQAARSATVSVTPPDAALPDGPVESSGDATITPARTTIVALQVPRFLHDPQTASQQIEVATGATEVLAASMGDADAQPGCDGRDAWATVHARNFAPELKVATVASHSGDTRTYELRHAGITAGISPASGTTAFSGAPLAGDWQLKTPLAASQTCRTIPHNLMIDVITQCVTEPNR